jgi:hypothetical protein
MADKQCVAILVGKPKERDNLEDLRSTDPSSNVMKIMESKVIR